MLTKLHIIAVDRNQRGLNSPKAEATGSNPVGCASMTAEDDWGLERTPEVREGFQLGPSTASHLLLATIIVPSATCEPVAKCNGHWPELANPKGGFLGGVAMKGLQHAPDDPSPFVKVAFHRSSPVRRDVV